MKFGMRLDMRGWDIRIWHILMMNCCRYLGESLTSCVTFIYIYIYRPHYLPIETKKRYNGWGVTLFDSLDTMWIMGLKDEFTEAVDSIRDLQFHATKVKQQQQKNNNHVHLF